MDIPWRQIGRYQIDRQIGVGGMALTFRGRLAGVGGFEKLVVIKLIHPSHSDDAAFLNMFLDEARLTARLTHPNIAQIFEIDVHQGLPYIVMELVNGPSLATLAKKLVPPKPEHLGPLVSLMAGVARALSHAHTLTDESGQPLNIIHRDVSLGNIVVAPTGTAKLIDFGIARWANRTHMTEVGVLKGKTQYLAPEQMAGKADQRVDIYQVGVCLYWLCTGEAPYAGENTLAIWSAQMEGKVKPISEHVPGFPPALEAVIAKAMATDLDQRYQTAADLAEALAGLSKVDPALGAAEAEVAAWMRGLFSDDEWGSWNLRSREASSVSGLSRPNLRMETSSMTGSSANRALPALSSTGNRTAPQPAPPPPPPTALQRYGRLLGGAAFIGLTALLALSLTQEPVEEAPVVVAPAGPTPAEQAAALLDQAEGALTNKELDKARQLLDAAEPGALTSPDTEIRLLRDRKNLDHLDALARGTAALTAKDYEQARTIARGLLDTNPEDAEARAILDAVVAATQPPPPPPSGASHGASAPKLELVTLILEGTVGATVDIDDQKVGVLPVRTSVTPGTHRINLAKNGYLPDVQSVQVGRGRTTTVKLAEMQLRPPDPVPTPPPPPEPVVEAPPPAPPPEPTPPVAVAPPPEPVHTPPPTPTPTPAAAVTGRATATKAPTSAAPGFAGMAPDLDAAPTTTPTTTRTAPTGPAPVVNVRLAPTPTPAPAPKVEPTPPKAETPTPAVRTNVDLRPKAGGLVVPTPGAAPVRVEAQDFAAVPKPVAEKSPASVSVGNSKLPPLISAHSLDDVRAALGRVEADAIDRGVPGNIATGVTARLLAAWTTVYPAPSVYSIKAAEMSNLIAKQALSGGTKKSIAQSLVTTFGP